MSDGLGWLLLLGGAGWMVYRGIKGAGEAKERISPAIAPTSTSSAFAINKTDRYEPALGRNLGPDEVSLDELDRAFQLADGPSPMQQPFLADRSETPVVALPLSPGEINRRKVAEILSRHLHADSVPHAAPIMNVPATPSAPIGELNRYEPALGRNLRPDEVSLEELERAFQLADGPSLMQRPFLADRSETPAVALSLSPGEINRRRVAEILNRFLQKALSAEETHSISLPASAQRPELQQSSWAGTSPQRTMPNLGLGPEPVRWFAKGQSVEVAGVMISDDMVYVGEAVNMWSAPRCVIVPSCDVAKRKADVGGQHMDYRPSYSRMAPSSRLAYLRWLAGGRNDPDIHTGYVFLYFYGLEMRLLKDRAMDEATEIIAEVERLRALYGGNNFFGQYSTDFLDAVDLLRNSCLDDKPPTLSAEPIYGLPPRLLIGLGHQIADGKPLDADWTLAWLLAHPEVRLRTPARRAFDEFCQLYRLRFAERYPSGLKVSKPKSTIGKLPYRVASADFVTVLEGDFSAWPSVLNLTKPVNLSMEVAERCVVELDAYSRFLGRSPDAKDSLQAKLMLPAILLAEAGGEVTGVLDWLRYASGALPVADVLGRLGVTLDDGKLGKAQARAMADTLERLGHGMEPDVRLGGRTPKLSEHIVLFRLPDGVREQAMPSPAYSAAALTLALCAVVAHADEVVTPEEERHLLALVEANLHLEPLERARLEAHALWLLAVPPSLGQIQSRIVCVPEPERHRLGRFVIALAVADGHVSVEELKVLERIYKLLGLDPARLFSDIHALQAGDDEPVVVRRHQRPPYPRVYGGTGTRCPVGGAGHGPHRTHPCGHR